MSLRDSVIVAYAETKVMKKSDRDVWVLAGSRRESPFTFSTTPAGC